MSASSSAPNQLPVTDSTAPPNGQIEDRRQGAAEFTSKDESPGHEQKIKEKETDPNENHKGRDEEEKTKEEFYWKEGGKKKSDHGGKAEWEKFSKERYNTGKKMYGEGTEVYQKDRARRGDEGKTWRDRKGEKGWEEKTERKERNGERDWGKAKPPHEGKPVRKGQNKDWKETDNEEHKGRKEKEGHKESSKEKWVKNHRKDKEAKKEWKTEGEWKNGKEQGKKEKWRSDNQKSRDPRKDGKGWDQSKRQSDAEWTSRADDKDGMKKDERKRTDAVSGEGKCAEERRREGKKDWQPRERGRPTAGKEEREGSPFQRDARAFARHREAQRGGRRPAQRRASLELPQFWLKQRTRLQRHPRRPQRCHSVEACAHSEGLPPVTFGEFEAVLQTYLARAQEAGVDASAREQLRKLAAEFFRDGVFVHDQMRFQDFVRDLGDVLEDMVEGEEDGDEEDSDLEDEMEGFHKDVMRRFAATGAGGKQERAEGGGRKEGRRGHA